MNRKGNVNDALTILFIIFGAAFSAIVTVLVINTVYTDFLADDTLPEEAHSIITVAYEQYPDVADYLLLMMFVGFPLISAVLAYFNNIHPLFFWISILLVIPTVIWGAALSELWTAIGDDADLLSAQESMPMMHYIFQNYALYALFAFCIVAYGSYIKLRGRNQFVI